jgi:formylglycine-generating enzyme
VGTKLPNELGIYDLGGNVWEWDWDWYNAIPLVVGDVGVDFRGPSDPTDPPKRELQGGSAIEYTDAACALDQVHWGYIPYVEQYHSFNNGFRVVRQ